MKNIFNKNDKKNAQTTNQPTKNNNNKNNEK